MSLESSQVEAVLYNSFEIVRARIASILALELPDQTAKSQARLDAELLKHAEERDQNVIDAMTLNLLVIPSVIYEERFIRPQPAEMPIVNVVFSNAPLSDLITNSSQVGEDTFTIEVYMTAPNTATERGDKLASVKLHRLLAICRTIIMDRAYKFLCLPLGIIGYVHAQNIVIGQPEFGGDDAENTIIGKIDINVKMTETVADFVGVPLTVSNTVVKLYDEDKGYTWEIDNT